MLANPRTDDSEFIGRRDTALQSSGLNFRALAFGLPAHDNRHTTVREIVLLI
jgi:hypothetical protein